MWKNMRFCQVTYSMKRELKYSQDKNNFFFFDTR